MNQPKSATYSQSGVDLAKADSFLGAMLGWIGKTESPGGRHRSLIPNGYYASVLDLGMEQALALATDGVGSKILVAEMAGDYSGVGIDCIAMNVNDLICVGADPVAMVDYLAIQDPPVEVGEQLGRSLYEGAKEAGISIPGGELAQLPEMIRGLRDGEGIDLAGAAFGLVRPEAISEGKGLVDGDVLLGVASNGVHSNGFTLVRNVVFDRQGMKPTDKLPELGDRTIGEELLRPTALYVSMARVLHEESLFPKALLHITGGGFLNLLRVASDNIQFVIETPPDLPPIFRLLQEWGSVSDEEMHRVFNLGVGMVLAVAPDRAAATQQAIEEHGKHQVFPLGKITAAEGKSVLLPTRGLVGRGETFEQAT